MGSVRRSRRDRLVAPIIQAAATYKTTNGTYVVLRPSTGTLTAFRITATNPPTIATGWSVSSSGRTSPFVTSTDGATNAIVWAAGSDGRLRGYNGDNGAIVFSGGGANELMTGVRSFNTGIAARGRIYYATDNKVYAFSVPGTSADAYRYRYSDGYGCSDSYRDCHSNRYRNGPPELQLQRQLPRRPARVTPTADSYEQRLQ